MDWKEKLNKIIDDNMIGFCSQIGGAEHLQIEELIQQELEKAREEGYELACKYLRDEYLEDRKRSLELRSEPKDVLDILGRVWSYKSKLKSK